jgi:Phosphate-selective porin O and P
MYSRLLVAITISLLAVSVRAQGPPPPDQSEQIRALLERVDRLEKRVAELEAKEASPQTPALSVSNAPLAPAPAVQPQVASAPSSSVHSHDEQSMAQQVAMQQAEPHYPSLQIRGFGDVDFSATDQKGTNSGFYLGQLDLHFASALSQKISYFAEITLNAHPNDYTVEVERSFIRYDYNDYFKISFGRFHTPIGYWNTAFHHGAWLQTTIDRPLMVRVGGQITPLHLVGFLAEGTIPSGWAGLGYNVGVGNGRGEIITRPGDAGDINNNRAWVVKIYSRPPRLYGLELGASVYRDKITLSAGQNYREWITDAYLVWTKGSPEFLGEYEHVNHQNILTGQSANTDAFYTQFAYRLPWFERTLKPYYRLEYAHMPLSEQVFTHQDQVESIVGLRYDISNYAAFKTEYRRTGAQPAVLALPPELAVNGVFFQTDFTF